MYWIWNIHSPVFIFREIECICFSPFWVKPVCDDEYAQKNVTKKKPRKRIKRILQSCTQEEYLNNVIGAVDNVNLGYVSFFVRPSVAWTNLNRCEYRHFV